MQIVFILVEPAVPENIGAAARALNTMGFSQLRIVNPKTELSGKARIVAHGSHELLENAEIYSSFTEAIADLDFIIATSAKKRRTNEDYVPSSELSGFLKAREQHIHKAGILFGREESGLSNDEISIADLITSIPLKNPYPSLNLSHAVMIFAYELSGLGLENVLTKEPDELSLKHLKEKMNQLLENIEIKQSHIIQPRIMERLSYLSNDDLNLFHSVLSALLEKDKT